jgi:hypothetical protein
MKSSGPTWRALPVLSSALASLLVWGFANYGCTSFGSAGERQADAATADDGAADGARYDGAADGSGHPEAGTSYRDIVLSDRPLAYWRLGETPPEIHAHDETGNGNDGLYVGDITLGAPGAIAGDPNGAVQMAGDGHVDIGDKLDFAGNVAMTIEAWVETDASGDEIFVEKTLSPGADAYLFHIYNPEGSELKFTRGASCIAPDAGGRFGDAKYHHLVANYDTETMRIYFDGELLCIVGFPSALDAGDGPLHLGSLNGRMDEVAIYDHVLAPATVKRHYDVGMGR